MMVVLVVSFCAVAVAVGVGGGGGGGDVTVYEHHGVVGYSMKV